MKRDLKILTLTVLLFSIISYLHLEGHEWVQWFPVAYGGFLIFSAIVTLGTKMGRQFFLAPRKKTVSSTVVFIERFLLSSFLICTGWIYMGIGVGLSYTIAKIYRYMNQ